MPKLMMYLTEDELNRGDAIRSIIRVSRHYRIGDVRKTIDKNTGYSFGTKVEVTDLIFHNERKMKVVFRKIQEK